MFLTFVSEFKSPARQGFQGQQNVRMFVGKPEDTNTVVDAVDVVKTEKIVVLRLLQIAEEELTQRWKCGSVDHKPDWQGGEQLQ